jgi:hypothetical protein
VTRVLIFVKNKMKQKSGKQPSHICSLPSCAHLVAAPRGRCHCMTSQSTLAHCRDLGFFCCADKHGLLLGRYSLCPVADIRTQTHMEFLSSSQRLFRGRKMGLASRQSLAGFPRLHGTGGSSFPCSCHGAPSELSRWWERVPIPSEEARLTDTLICTPLQSPLGWFMSDTPLLQKES